MSYHNKMMDIRERRLDSQFASTESRTLYKEGHRDARHAAAEIALKADKRIEKLENALQEILSVHANDNIRPKAFYIASDALENK